MSGSGVSLEPRRVAAERRQRVHPIGKAGTSSSTSRRKMIEVANGRRESLCPLNQLRRADQRHINAIMYGCGEARVLVTAAELRMRMQVTALRQPARQRRT